MRVYLAVNRTQQVTLHNVLFWQLVSAPELSHHQTTNKNYKMEALYLTGRNLPLYVDEYIINIYIYIRQLGFFNEA